VPALGIPSRAGSFHRPFSRYGNALGEMPADEQETIVTDIGQYDLTGITDAKECLSRLVRLNRTILDESGYVPEPGEDVRTLLIDALHQLAIQAAGADGRIGPDEQEALRDIFGRHVAPTNYAKALSYLEENPTLIQSMLRLVETVISLHAKAVTILTRTLYSAERDNIVHTIGLIGQTILAADEEARCEVGQLGRTTSYLREWAVGAEKKIRREFGSNPLYTPRQADSPPSAEPSPVDRVPAPEAGPSAPPAPAAGSAEAGGKTIEQILAELHQLVGLQSVKEEVETLANLARIFSLRKQRGMKVPDLSLHLVFLGNPGTGKTSVARIVSQLYGRLGLLSKGHLVEVDRSGLVANYVGQTATKVREVIDRAMGGVLFIDEAYSLASKGENDYGIEAIETLLKAMEDHREDLIVIAAGYTDEMQEFLASNPGLRSRFARDLVFPDYTPEEMAEIFRRMAEQAHYRVDPVAEQVLQSMLQQRWAARGLDFANAREVRNLFERAVSEQANRLSRSASLEEADLSTLTAEDLTRAGA
jgi:Holliday junction resolvasome RuvABC ATP-dependent DNA helicase subunit